METSLVEQKTTSGINPFRGYIRTKDKKPIQKFGNGEKLLTLEEAEAFDEYAGVLNGNFTIKDVDDADEGDRLYNLVTDLDLNCRVYQTTRGKQFMFASSEYCKSGVVRAIDALGFTFDVRTGTNMYTVLKFKGEVRQVLREFDETRPLEPYPKWLSPIRSSTKFTGMGNGDGRNAALFQYIGTLIRNNFTSDEIKFILPLINEYAFSESLSKDEMKKICRDEAIEKFMATSAAADFGDGTKPTAFTDVGMAEAFARKYQNEVCYTPATGWLSWQGAKWEASELKVQNRYIEFSKTILADAQKEVNSAYAQAAQASMTDSTDAMESAKKAQKAASDYYRFAIRMSDYSKSAGVLKYARSLLEINVNELDADAFALNTPTGILDLRTGCMCAHTPEAKCTKMTLVSPSSVNCGMWDAFIEQISCGNNEYQRYLQCMTGATAIGRVYHEALVIAHGDGANGKSTMFNTIYAVLGDYAGKIPAEALTTKAKNIKVDLAELFGKRFILAAELEEGQRLSTSMLKQIASIDPISAERKYRDPFTFTPTHSTVLYTNYLPKIGSNDRGTWRRIVVAPFLAEIKNPQTDFAERLLQNAGGAALEWIAEGAKMFIENGYRLPDCGAVDAAVEKYRDDNDWMRSFLEECCNVGQDETSAGGELYKVYRAWAEGTKEYARRGRDFANALRTAGFTSKKILTGVIWSGLSLSPERQYGKTSAEDEFLDFLE